MFRRPLRWVAGTGTTRDDKTSDEDWATVITTSNAAPSGQRQHSSADQPNTPAGAQPIVGDQRPRREMALVGTFVIVPLLALMLAVPAAWGWGLGWTDVLLAAAGYCLTGLGVSIGFHRFFTHGAFRAARPLRIVLAVAGSMSVQGSIIGWVADHRRHHAYADKEGDPHSPWRYGTSALAVARGFWHAHMGWLFNRNGTNKLRFAPDLLDDRDIVRIDRLFPVLTAVSLVLPALLGGLLTWSVVGVLTAFFWAGLVRVAVLHHVTWSVNSVCHIVGDRPFRSRDRSANFWPLAVVSFGESWHNSHHADPTCARHGVQRGQVDISAGVIRLFERLGWVWKVRWPTPQRLAKLGAD